MWPDQQLVTGSIDNHDLPALHLTLDKAIDKAYTLYCSSPAPFLHQWFLRAPHEVYAKSLDCETRWLEMISTAQTTP